jgi:HlyD family secretion protein
MKTKFIFVLSGIGVVLAIVSAYFYSLETPAQTPVFNPAPNPYAKGIYAEGIVESVQASGANVNIYPEVTGVITQIPVAEGQIVKKGTPLMMLDDSVQRATTEQQKSQAEAALALLQELKAQPRPENLKIAEAQVEAAAATLRNAQDQFAKQKASYDLEPKSVSKDTLDNFRNALKIAQANLEVAQKQYELTKAGAWSYDIQNQARQYDALAKSYASANALLGKYTIKAPADGVVLAISPAVGSYISPQGTYDTYSQGAAPVITLGSPPGSLGVRVYVDEILVHRLPAVAGLHATMYVRGTDFSAPLEFVRMQPYVSPKIELSNQRTERVDVRVLPLIFKFPQSTKFTVYPGQLVDVYIGDS